jgi:putative membrane protein
MSDENIRKAAKADPPLASGPAPSRAAASPVPHTFRTGLSAALGLGPGKEAALRSVDENTRLAVERSYLAADRTLMAWIRTALSMISFGFTIGKLGQTVEEVQVEGLVFKGVRMVSIEGVAYLLVVLGTLALFGAVLQYLANTAEYAVMGLRRRVSLSFVVALVLVVLGGFAFTALVLRL